MLCCGFGLWRFVIQLPPRQSNLQINYHFNRFPLPRLMRGRSWREGEGARMEDISVQTKTLCSMTDDKR